MQSNMTALRIEMSVMRVAMILQSILSAVSLGVFIPGRGCGTITPIKVVSSEMKFGSSIAPCTQDVDVPDNTVSWCLLRYAP